MDDVDGLRSVHADNPGPFTLDGTRTWILGTRVVAVIDPGPDVNDHVRAVVRSVGDAEKVIVVVTHGHPDHASGVDSLVAALSAALPGLDADRPAIVGAGHPDARLPQDGEAVPTDAGDLVCIHTPGHTRDHLAFHHPTSATLFAGDLVLGEGDTTWVAEYPGCVADYLASLDRVDALGLRTIHPAHGPVIRDPGATIARYRAHRELRVRAVRRIRRRHPAAGFAEVYAEVYGDEVPEGMRAAAEASLRVLIHHVDTTPTRG